MQTLADTRMVMMLVIQFLVPVWVKITRYCRKLCEFTEMFEKRVQKIDLRFMPPDILTPTLNTCILTQAQTY